MPKCRQESLNKVALNGLLNVYEWYMRLVFSSLNAPQFLSEMDVLYLRGGLREMIKRLYAESHINAVEAGSPQEPLTIEKLLPTDTISLATGEIYVNIQHNYGKLKTYVDKHGAHSNTMSPEVTAIIRDTEALIERQRQRGQSGGATTHIDIETAIIRYDYESDYEGVIFVNSTPLTLRIGSKEDYVARVMFSHTMNTQVSVDTIESQVRTIHGGPEGLTTRQINEACRGINEKIQKAILTNKKLFDTSVARHVIRRYGG